MRECPSCFQDADVGFIIDSSASIDNQEYQDQKDAVKSMIQCLHESGDGFITGMIQFSADAEIIYHLNAPESAVNITIDNMDRDPSTTRIDKALRLAQSQLFTRINGDREFIPNVLFVALDGSQTKAQGWENPNGIADEIRAAGTDIVVLGIGNEISQFEILQLAGGRQDRVFYAKDFDEFTQRSFIKQVIKRACVGKIKLFLLSF